jgi:hypothetical protein
VAGWLVFPLPHPAEDLDAWTQHLIDVFWETERGLEVDGAVDTPAD